MNPVIFDRFPGLAKEIFEQLDNQDLYKCREVSRTWCNIIKRPLWARIIQSYTENIILYESEWKLVLKKIPTENLEELAWACRNYSQYLMVESQMAPLHLAAHHGNLSLYKKILKKFKNKDPIDKDGNTPLWYAAAEGNFDTCEFLIESAMDKNPKGLSDWTPLHVAASEGHLEVCELISDNVTDQSPVTNEGETPLYHAALENHLDICKFLMSKAKLYIAGTINAYALAHEMFISSLVQKYSLAKLPNFLVLP